MSAKRKALSPKSSRRLLFGLLLATLSFAFFSALGIKNAAENAPFQEEVKAMRQKYDPNYDEAVKSTQATSNTQSAIPADTTSDSTQTQ